MRLRDQEKLSKHKVVCQSGDADHGKIFGLIFWEDMFIDFCTCKLVILRVYNKTEEWEYWNNS